MNNGLSRIGDDRIIIGGDKILKVISLFNKNVIKEIIIPFQCWGICLIKYLVEGLYDIYIFKNFKI